MTAAQMQHLRYRALTLGLRICKLYGKEKFLLYRTDGKTFTAAPHVMTLAELEATLADLAAEVAAD